MIKIPELRKHFILSLSIGFLNPYIVLKIRVNISLNPPAKADTLLSLGLDFPQHEHRNTGRATTGISPLPTQYIILGLSQIT
jgi:hypothetical protein